jgi:hypothetical protein
MMSTRLAAVLASWVICASCAAGAPTTGAASQPFAAEWRMEKSGPVATGLKALSGSDGFTRQDEQGGQPCLALAANMKASAFIYFKVDQELKTEGPLYATLEYFDQQFGSTPIVQYDSDYGEEDLDAYRAAEDQAGEPAQGGGSWRIMIYELRKPRFAGRENLSADLRVAGGKPVIRSLKISSVRPPNWNDLKSSTTQPVNPVVKIGAGGELIVGGFDPTGDNDVEFHTKALERAMPALKAMGVTSHEVYVRWNLCEKEPGKWDWSIYDKYVEIYKRHRIKWVPFIICGSAYSLPDWYYKKYGSQGYVCLEHGEESDVQSLWNPTMRDHVASFLKAFCEHYRDTGTIESILLGVTGNYGEAIYPASGNDWTADRHGKYHTHAGFWAGDPLAVASFRLWLTSKYETSDKLRLAWGENAREISMIRPFLQKDSPNDRAWIDMIDWYTQSMTDYTQFWLAETRKNLPKGEINVCTGGHAPPEHGADFGEQCRIAAEVGGGVRITNEASDYQLNFSITRWVASAAQQYNAYFSFEPAGPVDARGVVARVYNATASGARGLHYYYGNLFDRAANTESFIKWGSRFTQRKPITEIAVYYPSTWIKLNSSMPFLNAVRPLRDRFDFAYLSDKQILDGGLKRVQALVVLLGNRYEERVLEQIKNAQKQGLLLVYADGLGRVRTVEGDESASETLFGEQMVNAGNVAIFQGEPILPEYRDLICTTLAKARQLSPATRMMVKMDSKEDKLFVTLSSENELLWLNASEHEAVSGAVQIPPFSIVTQHIQP